MVPVLVMTEQHQAAIAAHGERAYPNECCGFLLGRQTGGEQRVEQVVAAVNEHGQEEQYHRFTITPLASFKAEKTARKLGLDILGHYHSHPDAPARPSSGFDDSDLSNATWPGYAFAIVSIAAGRAAGLTSWVLAEDRSKFLEQPIKITTPETPETPETQNF